LACARTMAGAASKAAVAAAPANALRRDMEAISRSVILSSSCPKIHSRHMAAVE
jgi:hypothetical protein